ncbi:hypothetical protein ACS0TY_029796 [Phlomoides rotata]
MAAERRLHDDLWCGSKSAEYEGSSETSNVSLDVRSTINSTADSTSSQGYKNDALWKCDTCTLLNQVH